MEIARYVSADPAIATDAIIITRDKGFANSKSWAEALGKMGVRAVVRKK